MHMRTPSSPPHSGILVPRGKLLFNLVPQQPARDRANMSSKNASNCRVVVVGGGIIGLTTALALLERGFRNVKIVAKAFDATTSHVAGGLWMPFELPSHVDPTTPRKWCEVSYAWLEKMAELHGHDATGLHKVEAIDVSAEGEPLTTAPYWGHVVENYKILNGREASAVFPGMTHGASFRTIIYNTTTFMELVTREVRKLGGVLEQREITSLDDVDCDLLINCSGLAAKQLANDDTVYPIRGQVIKVYNPRITKCVMAVDANSVHTYIIPRPNGDVVLGGTVQPNNWNASSNDADADAVWERCCKLYPEVKSSRVMARVAGLRPGRADGVRLEADARPTARGAFVIHNYGHSGSGHTLQWGCAQDVVELAAKKFPVVNSSKL